MEPNSSIIRGNE